MEMTKIWFDKDRIYGLTDDGRTLWQSLLYYRRLMDATEKERMNYEINHFGIHWPDIDEDVSFESFEYDHPEPSGISRFFLSHPELKASVVARRLGMKQSLLAAYINGDKTPSEERVKLIMDEVNAIGRALAEARI